MTSCSISRFAGSCAMRRCSTHRCGACSPIRVRAPRWWRISSASGCRFATCGCSRQMPTGNIPWFDDNLRTAFVKETELFLESQLQEDRSDLDLLTAELHVPQRTAGAPLRHSRCLRKPFPARDARGSESLGSARQSQRAVGHVVSAPHLADDPRQVAARKYSRARPVPPPPPDSEYHAGRGEDGQDDLGARDAGASPRESGVRGLSRAHGSAGFQPRELRCDWSVAHDGWRRADRRVRRAARRHESRRTCGASRRAAAAERTVRQGRDSEAADVRVGPRDRIRTTRRRFARSCALPPPTITAGRRRFSPS